MLRTRIITAAVLTSAFSIAAVSAQAGEPLDVRPTLAQAEMHEAFQYGAQAYRQGDKQAAIIALEKAAEGGHVVALWKLGRMYEDGDGVDRDRARAFRIFHRIANEFADASPFDETAPAVASAFVELAGYYATGIADTVEPNARRATSLLQHAASYFGNTEAQYRLGQLYAEHADTKSDMLAARRWLSLAADKGHVRAQAALGIMLWTGDGDRRFPARGLAWLLLACENAVGDVAIEVRPRCNEALTGAKPEHRARAEAIADQWRQSYASRRGSS